MIELFSLYKFAFVLCFLVGLTLCLQGTHLIARKESLQILALSQGALVGNLLGRLIIPGSEIASIISSLIIFVGLKVFFIISLKKTSSKETFFIVTYISLLSVSYLLISLFPGLEGHMSVGFFGDIVSLSENMTFTLIVLFLFFLVVMVLFHKKLFIRTFEKSVLGIERVSFFEEVLFALVLVCSLYGLGFLFTVATMIFPAVIVGTCGRNLKVMLISALFATSLSVLLGLGSSIAFERLSTVPSQIITLLIFLSAIGGLMSRLRERQYIQS